EQMLGHAREEADKIVSSARLQSEESERAADEQAEKKVDKTFQNAMMLGIREVKVVGQHSASRKAVIVLDPTVLTFAEKAYIRYSIQNKSGSDLTFTGLTIEGDDDKPIPTEVIPGRAGKNVRMGESLTGVIVLDKKRIAVKAKLSVLLQGEHQAELARLAVDL
ncbi:MAG TPA: hypothetical protein VJX67_12405, partial [Blastocatellia bacterium]|nr:hypothetical protein [Blastocatellia bacterium]